MVRFETPANSASSPILNNFPMNSLPNIFRNAN
jgi:hypothetical protein